jgi:hypothetical protein
MFNEYRFPNGIYQNGLLIKPYKQAKNCYSFCSWNYRDSANPYAMVNVYITVVTGVDHIWKSSSNWMCRVQVFESVYLN